MKRRPAPPTPPTPRDEARDAVRRADDALRDVQAAEAQVNRVVRTHLRLQAQNHFSEKLRLAFTR